MSVKLMSKGLLLAKSHRNPSGPINKASWLLSESKRAFKTLTLLYSSCGFPPHASIADKQSYRYQSSWEAAYVMARYCIAHNISKASDVFNSINFNFVKGSTLKRGDNRWHDVLSEYFISFVMPLRESQGITWTTRPDLTTLYFMYEDYVNSGDIKPLTSVK